MAYEHTLPSTDVSNSKGNQKYISDWFIRCGYNRAAISKASFIDYKNYINYIDKEIIMLISIITPIYHGKKYIKGLIEQVENCVSKLTQEIKVELVLSNDDPADDIDELLISDLISIIVLNTNINRGIHGARVRGLEKSKGDFVLFLDQDDIIYPNYLISQLQCMQDADAVVCRLIHDRKQFYTDSNIFEKILDYDSMITFGNRIVSPGQVLLRRDAIADTWQHNIMKKNGADDWLLWISMIAAKKKFVLNQDILFEHVVDGANTYLDGVAMLQSEDELYQIMLKEGILEQEKIECLKNTIKNYQVDYIRSLELIRKRFWLYDKWMRLESKKGDLNSILDKMGYRKIAVYGVGEVGRQLIDRLLMKDNLLVGAIDRNADYIDINIPVCKLEDFDREVDCVIVTLIDANHEVIETIQQKIVNSVFSMDELLELWEQY